MASMKNLVNRAGWIAAGVLGLLVVAALAGIVRGGPLDPPGTPGPTQQTQINSLPFSITQSGSYILTKDLTGVSGQNGITLDAPNVTIDLKGFALAGVPGALSGIAETGVNSHAGLVVTNGSITGWPAGAIDTPGVSEGRFDYLHVSGQGGVPIPATQATVRAGSDDAVDHVTLVGNGPNGITMDSAARISNCLVDGYQQQFGDGILTLDQSSVRDCTVLGFSTGINLGFDGEVVDSTVRWSVLGIFTNSGGTVRDCKVDLTQTGISVNTVSTVSDNTVTSTTSTTSTGVALAGESSDQFDGNQIINSPIGVQLYGQADTVTRNDFRGVPSPIVEVNPPGNDFPPQ